ncbi:MAG: hypothetical protein V4858_09235 [Pseudomonadota bacterium]
MQNQPKGKGIDMQQKAQDFLAALNTGNDVPGGLAFRNAMQAARLDYSMESLDRVDQLLRQIKTEFSPQRETWQERPGAENFCLMLAFYLGEMISRQTRQPIKWHTREQAAPFFPADKPLPVADWSRLVGIIAASMCVPLGFVEETLFGDSPATTSRAFVEERVAKLPKPPAKDENERCTQMLEAFFNDAGILGTLAFREQLEHSRLDHSLSSLERLDQLLQSIRDEIKPTYDAFVNKTDTQNFLRFVAFYIGMTTARAGNMAVKWLDFAEVKKHLPELEFQFEATSVCLLSDRLCFLLGLVTEILFHPDPKRSVHGWASEALKFSTNPFVSILRSSAHSDTVSPLDEQMVRAIHQAGFVAAWCMFMVEGGSVGKPTVFVPGEGDKGGLFTDFGFYDTLDAGVAAARNMLESNPRNSSYLVMSSDGYANLHTGRTDALTIELRVYASTEPSLQEVIFKMMVSCPYRNASDPKGFAIYSPKLVECSGPAAMNDALFKHFYLGIGEFKVKEFDWFKCLNERI